MVRPELERDAFRTGSEFGLDSRPHSRSCPLNSIHPLPACLDAQVTRKLASDLQGLIRPLNSSSSEGTVAASCDYYSYH
jgi:hypothetical protein